MLHTNTLVNNSVTTALSEASSILSEEGCTHTPLLEPLIDRHSSTGATNIFEELKTPYRQKKYFKEEMGLIEPKLVTLPDKAVYFGRVRTGCPQKQKVQNYVTIPFLKQLELLLNQDDIYSQVYGSKPKQVPGVFSRYEDGSAYQTNDLFLEHPDGLQIQYYIDEAQACDALGSKTIKNKLVFSYFALGNIEMKFRANLKSIFLLSIFFNHQVKIYGLNTLLRPVVDEIKQLERGVLLKIGNQSKMVFGSVTIFTADNLASHQVGGFKIGFAWAYRKCRYCLATDEQIQTQCCDSTLVYRTKETHALHCKGLLTSAAEHFKKLYSITHDSIFNELMYFNVIGGMVPDVMHDLLEGVLPRTICLMLLDHIKKKYYTIEQLNHALVNFKYGHSEVKNKPSVITVVHLKNLRLRQSASQLWQLAVTLPLAMGSMIPHDDQNWVNFTILLQVCRLVFRTTITELEIVNTECLIEEFLSMFKILYPNKRITPKFHFLLHYPHEIRRLGPLIAFWCMRYEAKHSYFKQLARAIGNWINLPLTLAKRHQQFMCMNFALAQHNYLKFKVEIPASKKEFVVVQNLTKFGEISCKLNIDPLSVVKTVPWIEIGSNCYKVKRSLVLCPLNGVVAAAFGLIRTIVIYENKVLFVCQLYRTVKFDYHFQAFELTKRRKKLLCAVMLDELVDYQNYHAHSPVDLSPFRTAQLNMRSIYVMTKTDIVNLLLYAPI